MIDSKGNFNYKIIDNFLPKEQHKFIENLMCGGGAFPWYFLNEKSADNVLMGREDLDNYQFVHTFYIRHNVLSDQYEPVISPLLNKIKPLALIRVKANLNPRTNEIKKYGWHIDYDGNKHTTAIYYVNSNDGKTFFKNGKEVDSVSNRLVIFNGDMLHTGSSCTDRKVRCVINLNYIEDNL